MKRVILDIVISIVILTTMLKLDLIGNGGINSESWVMLVLVIIVSIYFVMRLITQKRK